MEYFSPVWGGGDCVKLGQLDKIQSRPNGIFMVQCSDELNIIILPLFVHGRVTRDMKSAHRHSLTIPTCVASRD